MGLTIKITKKLTLITTSILFTSNLLAADLHIVLHDAEQNLILTKTDWMIYRKATNEFISDEGSVLNINLHSGTYTITALTKDGRAGSRTVFISTETHKTTLRIK